MKNIVLLLSLIILFGLSEIQAQKIGVGTNTPEGRLDITASDDGLLIPRVALTMTTDPTPLTSPTVSELVYNTSNAADVSPGFYYWNGSLWIRLLEGLEGADADWFEQGGTEAPVDISADIYTNGKVGINLGSDTQGAGEQLSIGGAFNIGPGSTGFTLDGNGEDASIHMGESAADHASMTWDAADNEVNIAITEAGSPLNNVVTIDRESGFGRVGINTADPALETALDVNGGNLALNDFQLRLKAGDDPNHFITYLGGAVDGPLIQGNQNTAIRSSLRNLGIFVDYNTLTNDWPGLYTGFPYAEAQTGGNFLESARLVRGRNGDGTLEFLNDGWGRIGGSNGLAFWANGNADGDDAPAMILLADGRLGFGTADPRGLVEINGSKSSAVTDFTFYAKDSYTGSPNVPTSCCAGAIDISLYATQRIVATEFDAISDARIKNIIGISDTKEDLKTLMGIEVTDYEMIDKKQSDKTFKKVIAQQVETVYPQAIDQMRSVVPDIFELASIQDGYVTYSGDLKSGEKVKLIFDDDHSGIYEVLSSEKKGFRIDEDRQGKVFIYGREVDDFRVVDYEAISMLNISATQEQQLLIEALLRRIDRLESINENLEKRAISSEARLDQIESILGLESSRR